MLISAVREGMEVIGADGVHVGTVDRVEANRLKLNRRDRGVELRRHHYLSGGLIADIEGTQVRLSATAAAALLLQEEETPADHRQSLLDEAGRESFPASDPPAID